MTAEQLLTGLAHAGLTVATAESLTGGLVCAALTDIAGSSAVVRGGVIAYATDVKARVLGVSEDLLARRGAVDADVALAMAEGVARVLGADIGVATTGVAGPAPSDGQPVGTVFVAVALTGEHSARRVLRCALSGDRQQIRSAAACAALDLLAEVVHANPRPTSAGPVTQGTVERT